MLRWQSDYDDVFYVELNGIIAEVSPADNEGRWYWTVFPMGRRSEFPEVYNSSVEETLEEAKAKAEASIIIADARYGYPNAQDLRL